MNRRHAKNPHQIDIDFDPHFFPLLVTFVLVTTAASILLVSVLL